MKILFLTIIIFLFSCYGSKSDPGYGTWLPLACPVYTCETIPLDARNVYHSSTDDRWQISRGVSCEDQFLDCKNSN